MTDEMFDRCTIEAFITEREGMIAMNAERSRKGEALAYGEAEFFGLMDRILAYRNSR